VQLTSLDFLIYRISVVDFQPLQTKEALDNSHVTGFSASKGHSTSFRPQLDG
jgi:hypothetical protein